MGKQVKKFLSARFCLLALLFLFPVYLPGCGEKDPFPTFGEPEITSVDPVNRPAGFSDFDLTVRGSGFVSSSVISFDGGDIAATFKSDSELVARIPRSQILELKNVNVFVRNPEIAGGVSNTLSFKTRELSFPGPPFNVSNTPATGSFTPVIAVDNMDQIHVVWNEDFADLYYSKSVDGGAVFSAPALPLSPSGASLSPKMVSDRSGVLHVVWSDAWDIFYSRSEDGGLTFSPGVNISNTPVVSSLGFSDTPAVSVNASGHIFVVWEEDFETFFSRSTNKGTSFSTPLNLSNSPLLPGGAPTTGFSVTPALASDNLGRVYAVWEEDYEIFFTVSINGGTSFSPTNNLSGTTLTASEGFSATPTVAVDGLNAVHVYWEEDFDILNRRSFNFGGTFDSDFSLTGTSGTSFIPVANVDFLGNILIGWGTFTIDGGGAFVDFRDITFFRSTDQGETFIGQGVLTPSLTPASFPAVAPDQDGNVYAVFEEDPLGISEVMFIKGD